MPLTPKGGKWWRFNYDYGGKSKTLSMGTYPDTSLKAARKKRDDARDMLVSGIDPGAARKAEKSAVANSFEAVASEWHGRQVPIWSDNHAQRTLRRLERDVFPWIGDKPIAGITAPALLECLRRVETRGAVETAHRVLQICGQVFRYAVATDHCERDPSGNLRGALAPVKGNHFASITEPEKVAGMLRALDGYEGTLTVCCALRLAPLVFGSVNK